MLAEGGHLSSLKVGANVGHLFSKAVNQEQGNTIVKGQGPSSSDEGHEGHAFMIHKNKNE
jgi:hypothetical protein